MNELNTTLQTEDKIKKKKEINILPEKRKQIIDEIRLVQYLNRMKYRKITNLLDSKTS